MRSGILICALSVSAAVLGAVRSSNTFALTAVATSSMTNTIVCIPWTGYTEPGEPTVDSRIDHIVSPYGLTDGDMILAVTNNVTYAAWMLTADSSEVGSPRHWTPITSSQKLADGSTLLERNTGDGLVARGSGLWLVRQNPGTKGHANPFYLYGQAATGGAEVLIRGGSKSVPTCTMLACPDASVAVNVNRIAWEGVGADDTLIVTTDSAMSRYYMWDATKKLWYYAKTSVSAGAIVTEYVTDLPDIPAGVGFWYVRRTAGDITVSLGASSASGTPPEG